MPARFPAVKPGAGHYESVYLKACHPDGGLGLWIRYTVHQRPGQPAKGFVWFTLFDAAAGVVAAKAQTASPQAAPDTLLCLGENRFAPGVVHGAVAGIDLDASWELHFAGAQAPLWHFPSRWMYRAPLPRTKLLSPYPGVRFRGRVQAGGRRLALDDWPGTVGHNWGSEHAERAIWLHGDNFAGHPDAWLDVAVGRVRLGPALTPWVANGVLCLDGRRHRLGGLRRVPSIDEGPSSCRFTLSGEGITVHGEASAPPARFVGWLYAQPDGRQRQTVNCSIADLHLQVIRSGQPPLTLTVAGGAAYELQMAERCAEIALQPYPDG